MQAASCLIPRDSNHCGISAPTHASIVRAERVQGHVQYRAPLAVRLIRSATYDRVLSKQPPHRSSRRTVQHLTDSRSVGAEGAPGISSQATHGTSAARRMIRTPWLKSLCAPAILPSVTRPTLILQRCIASTRARRHTLQTACDAFDRGLFCAFCLFLYKRRIGGC